MDGLRHNLMRSYSEMLQCIEEYKDELPGSMPYMLQEKLEDLRMHIAWIACVKSDNEENFNDLNEDLEKWLLVPNISEDE